jgi:hypothetical protein
MSPGRGSTPSQTHWLTVSRKVTWTWTCWHQSRLRYQQANIALLTSQPGSTRPRQHVITHQSLPHTPHRCPAGQEEESRLVAAQPAPHDTTRCSAGRKEDQPTPLLRANGSQPVSWHEESFARLPSANRYTSGPLQGQQTLQPTDCDTIALFKANKLYSKPADTTRAPPGFPDRLWLSLWLFVLVGVYELE